MHCRTGELHPSFPQTGEHAPTQIEREVAGYLDIFTDDELQRKKLPMKSFKYSAGKGNTSLKFHLQRYHPAKYNAVLGGSKSPIRKKRQACEEEKLGMGTLGSYFRSVKKLKRDSSKAQAFFQLVTLLIVLARLPFSLVHSPIFKAFVWFLDPTVPLPTRGDITNNLLPKMMSDCREVLFSTLSTVSGATVTFDLWMSKKTDNILSVDIHYICDRWTWQHKHLGLVAMSGRTRGTVVAKKLKDTFEQFNLMGRLFDVEDS